MNDNLRNRIDDIAQIAHELIISSKGFDNSQLEDAIKASGIDVQFFVNKEFDGFLKWDMQQQVPVIAINADQPISRQNFSMAHELGHLLIDWHWLPYGDNDNSQFNKKKVLNVTLYRGANYSDKEQIEETNVNEFAAAFLMPNSLLKNLTEDIKKGHISYSDALYKLTEKSKVSMMSAGYRMKNYCNVQGIDITNE